MKTPPNRPKELPTKKPYNSPQLQVYGNLLEITNTVTKLGSAQDDFVSPNRTR
jgi:hypothetical protein